MTAQRPATAPAQQDRTRPDRPVAPLPLQGAWQWDRASGLIRLFGPLCRWYGGDEAAETDGLDLAASDMAESLSPAHRDRLLHYLAEREDTGAALPLRLHAGHRQAAADMVLHAGLPAAAEPGRTRHGRYTLWPLASGGEPASGQPEWFQEWRVPALRLQQDADQAAIVLSANLTLQRRLQIPQARLVGQRLPHLLGEADASALAQAQPGDLLTLDRDFVGSHLALVLGAPDNHAGTMIAFLDQAVIGEAAAGDATAYQDGEMLLRGVAHDFNGVLAVLDGNFRVLQNRIAQGGAVEDSLTRIASGLARGSRLAKQVLLYGRKREPDWQPVDLTVMLLRLIDSLRGSLSPGIEVTVTAPEQPVILQSDSNYLEHILSNLIVNADEAMQGQGRVSIVIEESGSISVSDTGPGIPAEIRDRLFDPMVSSKARGTGLGLAIVRDLVAQLGGEISLAEAPGQGAHFRISFESSAGTAVKGMPR